jgi:hypothetical protein
VAILQEEITKNSLYLRALHIWGRNLSKVDTVLDSSDASQIHASIRWTGQIWELTDHSRNGILMNGNRLLSKSKTTLALGQKIQFSLGSNLVWQVVNLDPPCPMLIPMPQQEPVILLRDFHFLPDASCADASVYLAPGGQWIWEDETGNRILHDGDVITLRDQTWKFSQSQEITVTMDIGIAGQPQADNVLFDFNVSQNEEHIYLSLADTATPIDLGERTHHYCLLTLARRRHDDAARGIDGASQGWIAIDELSRMLGLEPTHINTQLFRARSQIMREHPAQSNLSNTIERRRGEVRFGAFRFRIMVGLKQEVSFTPPLPASARPLPPASNLLPALSEIPIEP